MDLILCPKDLKQIDEYMPTSEKERKLLNVFLRLPMSCIDTKKLEKIEEVFAPYTSLKRLVFVFDPKDYKISEDQMNTLLNFQMERSLDICIEDEYDTCPIGKASAAMDKIYAHCKFIEDKNLSPIEALMYAYFVATAKPYNAENEKKEEEEVSRSVYSIMHNNKIVCAGYCNLIMAIMNNLKFENVKLFSNSTLGYEDNGDRTLHATLICYIKDSKYGIDGYYFLDPTVDAEVENVGDVKKRSWFINNFLVSLGDMKYSDYEYKPVKTADAFIADSNEVYDSTFKEDKLDTGVRFSDSKLLINKDFQKALNDNIKIIDELSKNYGSQATGVPLCKTITKHPEVVEEALYNNSEVIPLDVLIRSMYKVFDAMKIYPEKDKNFLYTKKKINENILACQATLNFKPEAEHQINMCDELYKLPNE